MSDGEQLAILFQFVGKGSGALVQSSLLLNILRADGDFNDTQEAIIRAVQVHINDALTLLSQSGFVDVGQIKAKAAAGQVELEKAFYSSDKGGEA